MKLSKLTKPILKSNASHALLSWLISVYIRFVFATTKWTFEGFEERDEFCKNEQAGIVLFWHNRIALTPFGWPIKHHPLTILTSGHRDGRLVSKSLQHLGMNYIEGSSNKGGASALRKVIKVLKSGTSVGISPDGPRGPRMRVKSGAILSAKTTECPVSTMVYSVRKRKIMKSWDRFILPLPFNEGILVWQELKGIKKKASEQETETYRFYLEGEMTRLANKLDERMGHEPIEPADANEQPKEKKKRG